MPALTGKEGRRQPHLRHLAVASRPSVGFLWDALLVSWDPTSGWTRWSQCVEPPPGHASLTHAAGRPDTTGAVAGSGVAERPGGSSRKFCWAGRVGAQPAWAGPAAQGLMPGPPRALTQFHQKLARGGGGEGSQSSAHPEPGGSRAGSSAVPPRPPAQVARADGRRTPSGLRACLADVRAVLGYASSRGVLRSPSAVRSEGPWADRPACASSFPGPRVPDPS